MAIGAAFPGEIRRLSVVRQLTTGVVLHLWAILNDGERHLKRYVVVFVNDEMVVAFMMNTDLHPLVVPECQLRLDGFAYITHPCHLDCGRTRTFEYEEVVRQLMADTSRILGRIDSDVRDDIQRAMRDSPLIPDEEKATYHDSLDRVTF